MPTYAHEVNIHLVDVEGNLPYSLGSVSVEQNASFPTHLSNLFDVLDHPNLIVHSHDAAHQDFVGFLVENFSELVHVQQSIRLDGQVGYFGAL